MRRPGLDYAQLEELRRVFVPPANDLEHLPQGGFVKPKPVSQPQAGVRISTWKSNSN
jgi:hypothetical protein